MWIYPNQVTPADYKPKVGDIVVAEVEEYGTTECKVGVVVQAPSHDDSIDMMILNVDPDDLAFYG